MFRKSTSFTPVYLTNILLWARAELAKSVSPGRRRPSRMQFSTPQGSAFGTCRLRSTSSSKELVALGPEVAYLRLCALKPVHRGRVLLPEGETNRHGPPR